MLGHGRRVAAALVVWVSWTAAGCGEPCDDVTCGPCYPAILVHVTTATGAPATVTGAGEDWMCEPAEELTVCNLSVATPGDYTLTVSADGFQTREQAITLLSDGGLCCGCGTIPRVLDVTLVPE